MPTNTNDYIMLIWLPWHSIWDKVDSGPAELYLTWTVDRNLYLNHFPHILVTQTEELSVWFQLKLPPTILTLNRWCSKNTMILKTANKEHLFEMEKLAPHNNFVITSDELQH